MPIMIKEIDGLMIEKIITVPGKNCKCAAHGGCECGCGADWTDYDTYNEAIDDQGTRKIRTKREKIINILINVYPMSDRPTIERYADAIELNLKDILESC